MRRRLFGEERTVLPMMLDGTMNKDRDDHEPASILASLGCTASE